MLKNSKEKIVLRTALKTPFLSNNHKERTVQFATEMLQWSDAALENIIFCDVKFFTCKRSTRPTYLYRKSDPPKEQTGELEPYHGGEGITVWMGVSLKHGFDLHVFPTHDSQGNKVTVKGQFFYQAMKKRGGVCSNI